MPYVLAVTSASPATRATALGVPGARDYCTRSAAQADRAELSDLPSAPPGGAKQTPHPSPCFAMQENPIVMDGLQADTWQLYNQGEVYKRGLLRGTVAKAEAADGVLFSARSA